MDRATKDRAVGIWVLMSRSATTAATVNFRVHLSRGKRVAEVVPRMFLIMPATLMQIINRSIKMTLSMDDASIAFELMNHDQNIE